MIPHIYQAILKGFSRIVVLSNDTDVFIVILHYMNTFVKNGLKQLWLKYGTGSTSRYLPMHALFEKIGIDLCSVLLKAHILTGCDITSKVGTEP